MTDDEKPEKKTYDRIQALDLLIAELEPEEADAGKCPKCDGELMGFRRGNTTRTEGIVRCKDCGYFYVFRE